MIKKIDIYEVDFDKLMNMRRNVCDYSEDVIHRLLINYNDKGELIE